MRALWFSWSGLALVGGSATQQTLQSIRDAVAALNGVSAQEPDEPDHQSTLGYVRKHYRAAMSRRGAPRLARLENPASPKCVCTDLTDLAMAAAHVSDTTVLSSVNNALNDLLIRNLLQPANQVICPLVGDMPWAIHEFKALLGDQFHGFDGNTMFLTALGLVAHNSFLFEVGMALLAPFGSLPFNEDAWARLVTLVEEAKASETVQRALMQGKLAEPVDRDKYKFSVMVYYLNELHCTGDISTKKPGACADLKFALHNENEVKRQELLEIVRGYE